MSLDERLENDLGILRRGLAGVEAEARGLRWAEERPWRRASHLRVEGEMVHLDLHDLNASCAKRAVRAVIDRVPDLQTGAVAFITGVGRHSIGPGVLGEVVRGELSRVVRREGWSYSPAGKGALVLVFDPDSAPGQASSRLGPFFYLVAALLVLGLLAALPPAAGIALAGLLLLVLLVLLARWWMGSRPQ